MPWNAFFINLASNPSNLSLVLSVRTSRLPLFSQDQCQFSITGLCIYFSYISNWTSISVQPDCCSLQHENHAIPNRICFVFLIGNKTFASNIYMRKADGNHIITNTIYVRSMPHDYLVGRLTFISLIAKSILRKSFCRIAFVYWSFFAFSIFGYQRPCYTRAMAATIWSVDPNGNSCRVFFWWKHFTMRPVSRQIFIYLFTHATTSGLIEAIKSASCFSPLLCLVWRSGVLWCANDLHASIYLRSLFCLKTELISFVEPSRTITHSPGDTVAVCL